MEVHCCGDCLAHEGELHEEGCDQEICPICRGENKPLLRIAKIGWLLEWHCIVHGIYSAHVLSLEELGIIRNKLNRYISKVKRVEERIKNE